MHKQNTKKFEIFFRFFTLSFLGVLFFVVTLAIKTNAFRMPNESGGWFFEYQTLIAGVLAIFAASLALCAPYIDREFQIEDERNKANKIKELIKNDCNDLLQSLFIVNFYLSKDDKKGFCDYVRSYSSLKKTTLFHDESILTQLTLAERNWIKNLVASWDEYDRLLRMPNEPNFELLVRGRLDVCWMFLREAFSLPKSLTLQDASDMQDKGVYILEM